MNGSESKNKIPLENIESQGQLIPGNTSMQLGAAFSSGNDADALEYIDDDEFDKTSSEQIRKKLAYDMNWFIEEWKEDRIRIKDIPNLLDLIELAKNHNIDTTKYVNFPILVRKAYKEYIEGPIKELEELKEGELEGRKQHFGIHGATHGFTEILETIPPAFMDGEMKEMMITNLNRLNDLIAKKSQEGVPLHLAKKAYLRLMQLIITKGPEMLPPDQSLS